MGAPLKSSSQMDAKRFDEAVSPAFAFLVDEYGYVAEPATQPQHFLEPNIKRFRNGERSIGFYAGYDLPGIFVLEFSPLDMRNRRPPSARIEYRQRWYYTLEKLLALRRAATALPKEGATDRVAQHFADAVRSHALDVVSGDFRVFSPPVFSIEFVEPGHPMDGSTVGVCSTISRAEEAVAKVPDRWITSATKFRITGWEFDSEFPW
jgi:hypothetical protein